MDTSKYLNREAILAACGSEFLKLASSRLKHYFAKLDDQLFKLAERAYSNDAQARYFETINSCRLHRDAMQQRFLRHLEESFDHFMRQQPLQDARRLAQEDDEPLSLLDKDDQEEKIALSTLCRKAEAQCAEAIYALNQRLSVLSQRGKLAEEDNPFAPAVLSEAMRKAIALTGLETRATLLVLKVFDNEFMSALGSSYDQLNQLLAGHGILPNLRYQITNVSSSASPRAWQHTETERSESRELPPQAHTPESLSEFNQGRLLEAIQQVMQLRRGQASSRPAYSAQELVQQLDLMQHQGIHTLEQPVVAIIPLVSQQQLSQQLDRQRSAEPPRVVGDLDNNTIEIVGMLFAYMLNLETLPDSVKALLSHLHTPFLKVALLDKKFFKLPQHPARQLLNTLVAAGERWVSPDPQARQEALPYIRSTIQRVLKEFNNDVRLFTELNLEFNHLIRQLEHRARLAEQRATQAAQGQERLQEIRRDVSAELSARIGDQPLPKPLDDLLHEAWSHYLAYTLLRHGRDSADWQAAIKLVDDLLWFIQPKLQPEERQRASQRLPEIESALKQGLDTIGFDTARGQQVLSALKMSQRAATESAAPRKTQRGGAPVRHGPPQPGNEQEREALDGLKHIDFGTWFELPWKDGTRRCLKLAWYNANTSHYMFVNQMGQQVSVLDGLELARYLLDGRARIVQQEERPFFEKALERILSQLRGHGHDIQTDEHARQSLSRH